MRPLAPTLRRLTIGLFATVIGLLLGEALCRLFPGPAAPLNRLLIAVDDARGFALRPGARVEFKGLHEPLEPSVVWRVDASGRRSGREAVAGQVRRVLTYGDSETFGWAVPHERTFQHLLERRFPGLEMVNLGVPGYNVSEVALHVELTAADLKPDLLLYLVHPNDLEPSMMRVSGVWLRSALARRVLLAYQLAVVEPRNQRQRRAPESVAAFRDGMGRIVAVCRRLGIECVAVFLDRRDLHLLRDAPALGDYFLAAGAGRSIDVTLIAAARPWVDHHLPAETHEALAEALAERVRPPARAGEIRPRIDHVPIAVSDLAAARRAFEALGFVARPGRLHDNGLENVLIEFRDGTELELITVHRGGGGGGDDDDLGRRYLEFLEDGDGAAYLALAAGPVGPLAERLRSAGIDSRPTRGRAFDWLTFAPARCGGFLFFIDYPRRLAEPEPRAHPNSAVGLSSVWLAGEGGAAVVRTLRALGVGERPGRFPLDRSEGRVLDLERGHLHSADMLAAARPIVGLTVRVENIDRAAEALAAAGIVIEPRVDRRGRGLLLGPELAHGTFLELLESYEKPLDSVDSEDLVDVAPVEG